MRTISSRKFVTALAPPLNSGLPFEDTALSAGKIPAAARAAALGLIMQLGITLPGNCPPEVIPAGGAPPGQFAKRMLGATCGVAPVYVGTKMGFVAATELKSPPYVALPGTV